LETAASLLPKASRLRGKFGHKRLSKTPPMSGGVQTLTNGRKRIRICCVEIIVLDSAYKHGFTDESIYSCLFNSRADEMAGPTSSLKPQQTESWQRRLIVGFDHRGIALEIVGLEDIENDRLVVIHANKLQKKYYHLLPEGTNEL
jgi:hypothetical protein